LLAAAGLDDGVGVTVGVGVAGMELEVGVIVVVGVGVVVFVGVGVMVAVGVTVCVGVLVGVLVGVAVGEAVGTNHILIFSKEVLKLGSAHKVITSPETTEKERAVTVSPLAIPLPARTAPPARKFCPCPKLV